MVAGNACVVSEAEFAVRLLHDLQSVGDLLAAEDLSVIHREKSAKSLDVGERIVVLERDSTQGCSASLRPHEQKGQYAHQQRPLSASSRHANCCVEVPTVVGDVRNFRVTPHLTGYADTTSVR